jgi:hypothetical protein
MAVRTLKPGDLVYFNGLGDSHRRGFGLVIGVETLDFNQTYWHVVINDRIVRTSEVSVWMVVQ